ncbi:MAG: ImmA/IrrE family metallo-endopeptidase [Solibacillus sp.]|uniref:ImmA/IrrE family metallo-endopeptidase n=1 Tax=Solibacillus sp. TaxID=1909654 RepID=UPI0033150234
MAACLTHTEEYIKEFYLKMGITKPHELKFQTIAMQLGITTFYWPEQSQALFTANKAFILLNEKLTAQQQWQEFCHEVGHVLQHVGNQTKMPESFRTYQESKANIFMYHAAIPTFMLDQLHIYNLDIMTVYELQKLFNVEYDFAFKRLQQYLNNKHNMLNWNTFIHNA